MSFNKKIRLLLIIITLLAVLLSLTINHLNVSLWQIIFYRDSVDLLNLKIFLYLKLPTVFLAWLIGLSLGLVGCVMQGLLRNPLADPAVLGVSAGAGFFGILAVWLMPLGILKVFTNSSLLIFACASFLGAIIVMIVLYFFAKVTYRSGVVGVLLAGVALSSLFGALSMLIMSFANDTQLRSALIWSLGGVVNTSWSAVIFLAVCLIIGSLILFTRANDINLLALGEDNASLLGVNIKKLLLSLLLCSALIISATVAVAGPIAFVGLISPHIARMIQGPEHKNLMVSSALVGGIILLFAEYISLEAYYPYVIALGIIMALLGAPFFLWLLWKNYRNKNYH